MRLNEQMPLAATLERQRRFAQRDATAQQPQQRDEEVEVVVGATEAAKAAVGEGGWLSSKAAKHRSTKLSDQCNVILR